jgi:hypothetical protein
MKNLFEIDSNEIKRILSLHEESTKKQYLNVISEEVPTQATILPINNAKPKLPYKLPSKYNLSNANKSTLADLTIFKNTIFDKEGDNLVSNKVQYVFTDSVDHNTVKGPEYGLNVDTFTDTFWSASKNKVYSGKITFMCSRGKFSVGESEYAYYDKSTTLSKILSSLCKTSKTNKLKDPNVDAPDKYETPEQIAKAKKCGYSSWEDYKNGKNGIKWFCSKTNKIDSSQVTTFTPQQMVDTTKEVQTLMGIQNPTGQLTDTDIDLIITNLSK